MGLSPSFIQGCYLRINEAFRLSVGILVIWGDRDMVDLEGHTKILKFGHETINYPKSGEQFVEEIVYNFCSGISIFKDFGLFQKSIDFYEIVKSAS